MRSTVLSGTRRSLRRRRRSKVNSPAGDHPAFNNLCSVCQPIPWIWCIAINPSRSSIALPPKKRGTAGRSPENRCLFLRDALLKQTLLLQDLNQRLADVGRGGSHLHAAFLKLGDLFGGRSLSSGNDGPRMAHPLARRSRLAADEGHHRFIHVLADPLGGFFLGRAPDLTDQDDRQGVRIRLELLEYIDEIGPVDRVSADPDRRRLPDAAGGQLMNRLIGEGPA